MNYQATQKYLNSLINFENKSDYSYQDSFKLERIKAFLQIIGNPQEDLNCLHVAGSKGKGSTCAFMAYILKEAGFKTGLYTSPHLSDFRERIRILNPDKKRFLNADLRQSNADYADKFNLRPSACNLRPSALRNSFLLDFEGLIPKEKITRLIERLKPVIDKFNQQSEYGPLSFFEVYTAIAFQYFKDEKVDLVVLETGLGGRLDATNVVNSLISCITPVSLEHTDRLGKTLKKICREKSGIIKTGNNIAVTSKQEKAALEVIKTRCHKFGTTLFEFGRDFSFTEINPAPRGKMWGFTGGGVKSNTQYQVFNLRGILRKYNNLKINLTGFHQLINAATAVACVETLHFSGINIPAQAIKSGLAKTRWPARFEKVSSQPKIILDAAHSPASALALKETWKNHFNSHQPILVFGISSDKDIRGVASALQGISREIILTKSANPRAAEPQKLRRYFSADKNIAVTRNTQEAMKLALSKAQKEFPILVTGSLFVVAEARKLCLG